MKEQMLRLACLALAVAWRYWFRDRFPFPTGHVLVTAEEFREFVGGKSGRAFSGKDYRDAETE